jgi:hypothetical protein
MHAWLKNSDQHHWCHSYCQSLRLTLSYLLLDASHPHPADAYPKVVALRVWPSKEFPSSEHVLEPLVHRPLPRELGTTLLTARASLDMLEMSHKVTIEVVQGGTPPGRILGTDLVPTLGCDWLCWRHWSKAISGNQDLVWYCPIVPAVPCRWSLGDITLILGGIDTPMGKYDGWGKGCIEGMLPSL